MEQAGGGSKCTHDRSQMTMQNLEACAVEAKMATINGKSLVWENLAKR